MLSKITEALVLRLLPPLAGGAPGTLVTGQRGTTLIEQQQRKVDMSDKTLLLEPDASPLTIITKKISKKKTGNPKFSWMEDELDPRFDVTTGTFTNVATTINVTNGGYFRAQQIIYVPRTGESMRVVSVSVNALTVVRGVGQGGTGVAGNSGEEILIANTAQPEGDASKPAVSRNPTPVLNYTQIIRTEWDATNTELSSEFEGDDDWELQSAKHGIEHRKSIEYALMVNRPSEDTSSGQARRTTGGFNHFVTTNVTDVGGTMTELEFFSALRPMFRYGAKEKWGLASMLAVDVLNTFPRGKLEVTQNASTFGLKVLQYQSPHGVLNVVTHYLLEGATLGGQIWVLDTDMVIYRYLQNRRGSRDTALFTNIQAPDVDGRKDEWRTECGLQFGHERRHGKIINIQG